MSHLHIPRERVRRHLVATSRRWGAVRRQGEVGRFLHDRARGGWSRFAEVATYEVGELLAPYAREGGTLGRVERARLEKGWDEVRPWVRNLGPFDRGPNRFARRLQELPV